MNGLRWKIRIARFLNAVLGEIALAQHRNWIFHNPESAHEIVALRLRQIELTTKESTP